MSCFPGPRDQPWLCCRSVCGCLKRMRSWCPSTSTTTITSTSTTTTTTTTTATATTTTTTAAAAAATTTTTTTPATTTTTTTPATTTTAAAAAAATTTTTTSTGNYLLDIIQWYTHYIDIYLHFSLFHMYNRCFFLQMLTAPAGFFFALWPHHRGGVLLSDEERVDSHKLMWFYRFTGSSTKVTSSDTSIYLKPDI